MTVAMRRPRRVVQKSFDGTAAVNAFLWQNTVSIEYAKKVETARYLLEEAVCPTDVHKMMGLPLEAVRTVSRGCRDSRRVGRRPTNLGLVLRSAEGHLRVSVFLGQLERIVQASGEDWTSGESFAAAMKSTKLLCGDAGAAEITPRHLVLAVLEMNAGTCSLQTCSTCRVRFLRSNALLRVQSGVHSKGACPFCRAMRTGGGARSYITLPENASVSVGETSVAMVETNVFDHAEAAMELAPA